MMARFSLSLLLSASPWCVEAFFRTNDATSGLVNSYSINGPSINLTEAMISGSNALIQSFWYASYLSAENGRDYFAITCHSSSSQPSYIDSYVSLLDITTEEYYGTNNVVAGTITNTTYDIEGGGLRLYSSSPDLVSVHHAVSNISGASFNLTFEPRGPNLYHGGSGIHHWGDGSTTQIAFPQMLVTGTIAVDGTDVAIIPNKSVAWFDRQWGSSLAYNGWYFYNVYLSTGLVIAAWKTFAVEQTPKTSSFATVLFPDGHHEIHILDGDVHESGPFTSKDTNLTYHSGFKLSIPTLDLLLDATLPIRAGEIPNRGNQNGGRPLLFEGFAEYNGTLRGSPISGFGLVEQVSSLF